MVRFNLIEEIIRSGKDLDAPTSIAERVARQSYHRRLYSEYRKVLAA